MVIEVELVVVWVDVFGVVEVGVYDDFYVFGGDLILMLCICVVVQWCGLGFEFVDLMCNLMVVGFVECLVCLFVE